MRKIYVLFLLLSLLLLLGCGGGGSEDISNQSHISGDYQGKTEQASLNEENSKKFIRAINYMQNIDLTAIPQDGDNITTNNKISSDGTKGYIEIIYDEYNYNYLWNITGKIRTDILSVKLHTGSADIKIRTCINFNIATNDNNITYRLCTKSIIKVTEDKEDITSFVIEKYYLYDQKYNEAIEVVSDSTTIDLGKLYLSSEGYVKFENADNKYILHGMNSSSLELEFYDEEPLYTTDSGNERLIYSPKNNQGTIKYNLNGVLQKDLYFSYIQISSFKPPKFYENNGETNVLEYSFSSLSVNYVLLNQNPDNIDIKIEWYVNGRRVYVGTDYEFPILFHNNGDTLTVVITATNGDMTNVTIQNLNSNYILSGIPRTNYEFPENTFDIIYRANNLSIDLDILAHEYFDNIDLNNSYFSWNVGLESSSGYDRKAGYMIYDTTKYKKKPKILINDFGLNYYPLYLKIYSNHEVKVVRFNIKFERGEEGLSNPPEIIDSIVPSGVSNGYHSLIKQVIHYDIDKNGLDDIIYSLSNDSNNSIHINYQDSPRNFIQGEILENNNSGNNSFFSGSSIIVGRMDMQHDINIIPQSSSYYWNQSKGYWVGEHQHSILSIDRDDNITSVDLNMTTLLILKLVDIDNDGKDDILSYDENSTRYIIYFDENNMTNRIELSIHDECDYGILDVIDIDNDGLKDIVCNPKIIKKSLDDYTLYSDIYIEISYWIQKENNIFIFSSNEVSVLGSVPSYDAPYLHKSIMLDDNHIIIQSNVGYRKQFIFSLKLETDKITHLDTIRMNTKRDFETLFTPSDINHDGKKDIIGYTYDGNLVVLFQKDNYLFKEDYIYKLPDEMKLINSNARNAILCDIDKDGYLEIVTVNDENKFGYINFK